MFPARSTLPQPPLRVAFPCQRLSKPYLRNTAPVSVGGAGGARWIRAQATKRDHVGAAVTELSDDGLDVQRLPIPEGSFGLPILGEFFEYMHDPDFAIKRVEKHGPIFKTHYIGDKSIFICGLENIREAMMALSDGLSAWGTEAMEKVVGEKSVARMEGEGHHFIRKNAAPAFTHGAVDGCVPAIVERASELLETCANKGAVSFSEEAKTFAFSITAKTFAGLSYGEQSEEEVLADFTEWWEGAFTLPIDLPFTKFGKSLKLRKEIGELLQRNIEMGKRGEIPSEKALAIMLGVEEGGRNFTDKEIEDNIFTFLIAGSDTSGAAAASTLLELARHPEVFEKVKAEQEEVVSQYGPEISATTLKAMPYLEAAIKETLRVNPITPALVRKVTRTMAFKGYKIPKDWNVVFSLAATMRNLDNRWPGSTDFEPERFLTKEGKRPGGFVPFGLGQHQCLGNILVMVALKTLFALLVRGYDFEVDNLYPEHTWVPMPRPVDGMPVRFSKKPLPAFHNGKHGLAPVAVRD